MVDRRATDVEESWESGGETPAYRALLEELRELRRAERAPQAVCERVLHRLEQDVAEQAGAERHVGHADFARVGPIGHLSAAELGSASSQRPPGADLRPLLGRAACALLLVGLLALRFSDAGRRLTGTARLATEWVSAREPAGGELEAEAPSPAESSAAPVPRPPPARWATPLGPLEGPNFPSDAVVSLRGDVGPASVRNLITNGDFSAGDALWSVRRRVLGGVPVRADFSIQDGALCTRLGPDEYVIGGWPWEDRRLHPSSFEIVEGRSYRLSLRAWSPGPKASELVVKLGHQSDPFAPVLLARIPVASTPGRFDIDFVAGRSDASAGFAFDAHIGAGGLSGELCLDDVSVSVNPVR